MLTIGIAKMSGLTDVSNSFGLSDYINLQDSLVTQYSSHYQHVILFFYKIAAMISFSHFLVLPVFKRTETFTQSLQHECNSELHS